MVQIRLAGRRGLHRGAPVSRRPDGSLAPSSSNSPSVPPSIAGPSPSGGGPIGQHGPVRSRLRAPLPLARRGCLPPAPSLADMTWAGSSVEKLRAPPNWPIRRARRPRPPLRRGRVLPQAPPRIARPLADHEGPHPERLGHPARQGTRHHPQHGIAEEQRWNQADSRHAAFILPRLTRALAGPAHQHLACHGDHHSGNCQCAGVARSPPESPFLTPQCVLIDLALVHTRHIGVARPRSTSNGLYWAKPWGQAAVILCGIKPVTEIAPAIRASEGIPRPRGLSATLANIRRILMAASVASGLSLHERHPQSTSTRGLGASGTPPAPRGTLKRPFFTYYQFTKPRFPGVWWRDVLRRSLARVSRFRKGTQWKHLTKSASRSSPAVEERRRPRPSGGNKAAMPRPARPAQSHAGV